MLGQAKRNQLKANLISDGRAIVGVLDGYSLLLIMVICDRNSCYSWSSVHNLRLKKSLLFWTSMFETLPAADFLVRING
jgi:hypothetical protein